MNIVELLKGKKTIGLGAIISVLGIAVSQGFVVPAWTWIVLGGLGLAFLRDALTTIASDITEDIAEAMKFIADAKSGNVAEALADAQAELESLKKTLTDIKTSANQVSEPK